jgi:hypothetical protein
MKLIFSNLFSFPFYKYSFINKNDNSKVICNKIVVRLKEFFTFLEVNVFVTKTDLSIEKLLLRTEGGEIFFVTNK